jgi:hypothetical protein
MGIMLDFKYKVCTNYSYWSCDISKWLVENIGKLYAEWITDYYNGNLVIKFKNEEDAVLFALKWL